MTSLSHAFGASCVEVYGRSTEKHSVAERPPENETAHFRV